MVLLTSATPVELSAAYFAGSALYPAESLHANNYWKQEHSGFLSSAAVASAELHNVGLVLNIILSLTQQDETHCIAPNNTILACRVPSEKAVSLNPV